MPRLLGVFEACFLLICRATKYSILDTRALRLKNLKPAKFSFRSHNFQMAKFESWQAAIERCCQLQACIVRSDVQTDRQTDGRTDEQIQLNFGFTLSIKHTTRWPAAVKAIAGPWLLTSIHCRPLSITDWQTVASKCNQFQLQVLLQLLLLLQCQVQWQQLNGQRGAQTMPFNFH